jgi:SOS response regulatory protein OraA/RecX
VQEQEVKLKLMNKAGRLLSHRLYSCGEMRLKLLPFANEQEVDAALTRLKELNLLNDGNYAYNLALFQIAKQGWGPAKAFHSLLRHKIAPEEAQLAIERVEKEESYEVALTRFLEKSFRKSPVPQNRSDLTRLINRLRRRGFADATIFNTLRQKIPAAVWRTFDSGE